MKKVILLIAMISFVSCNQTNDDVVSEPNRDGSIEAKLSTTHNGDYDVLTTEYIVWVKGKADRNFIKIDTLKSLGTTKEQGEDKDGNLQDLTIPKDYEIYITVN